MTNVVAIDPKPQITAGHKPQAIVPQTMDEAYRFAKAVVASGMAPRGMDSPEKCMIAIMRGLEVGLSPFQALDKIAIVNGRPTIWGDGAIGLVRGSGLCEWVREKIEGKGDDRAAICEAKRRNEPEAVRRTFSVADAKRAGLWGKSGPWQQYPERMLQMRARAFALRDGFADVLGGLYLKEELEDTPASIPTPPAPPPAPAPAIEHKPSRAPEAAAFVDAAQQAFPGAEVVEATEADVVDIEALLKTFRKAAAEAQTGDDLERAWSELVEKHFDGMMPPDQDEFLAIHRTRSRELEP